MVAVRNPNAQTGIAPAAIRSSKRHVRVRQRHIAGALLRAVDAGFSGSGWKCATPPVGIFPIAAATPPLYGCSRPRCRRTGGSGKSGEGINNLTIMAITAETLHWLGLFHSTFAVQREVAALRQRNENGSCLNWRGKC
jgi:hypothetical protein